ncbi:hypothetical protein GUITHDRAFT_100420 [Guillardia theta CCMP2712]|uniref:Acyltransferase n=1 Tax=Guillardia theta (strain CCMP2712) TaxID=905079 RepID=L1JZY8_GUITC|nr:hypothetical protein GUITHDRAFT_100420 [Guillardia theta CCMP2712]EKX54171.1 hypothetical protein GUITHDRAFT_100420 [Guillardia theta CCMP2712]|eukprot:XP_005841151.1 hypothetical protein GUITHDRAFT_100420 [Guillardia theta CCMP2712]
MFAPLVNVFMAAYLVHIFRDKSPTTGSKKSDWFRRLSWWKHFGEYFPISLIPTAQLDPEQKYIFGYHPHGIISFGAIATFGTEGVGFSEIFKGIDVHLVTLPINFRVPFLREVWLRLGICDSSKETFRNILSKGSGSAIALVVGGANESLSAEPGTMGDLTLCKRRGFVRQALLYDACLVPVLGFGETDVFAVAKWPAVKRLQEKLQKTMGFAMPIFHGRGIFQKAFGLLPFRKPIHVVVGRPLNLKEIDSRAREAAEKGEKWLSQDPEGMELVERCHAAYVKELQRTYDDFKDLIYCHRTSSMRIR